jgi:TPR repeat protein
VLAAFCVGIWWLLDKPAHENGDAPAKERGAVTALKRRAERGDAAAQMELAESYCRGTGVRKNMFQCAEWYRKAANLGHGAAMLRLGDMYDTGEGFILDKEAAAMWWRKAESTADGAEGAKSRLRGTNADKKD